MNTVRRLLTYTLRYRMTFVAAGLISCLYGLFAASPALLLQYMVDTVLVAKQAHLLIFFVSGFVGLFVGKAVCMYFSTYYLQWVGYMVVNDIRRELFSELIYLPVPFFQRHATGDIMSRFLNDISTLQYASSVAIRNGLRSLVEAFALLSIALYQNVLLTGLSLIVAPLIAIAIKQTGRSIKLASRVTQNDMGTLSTLLQEAIHGIRSIKAFNGEKRERNRFAHTLGTYFDSIMKCVHYEAMAPPLIEIISISGISVVLFVASQQVINNTISPGQITSLFASMLLAYQPIKRLVSTYGDINYGIGAAQRVFALLDEAHTSEHEPTLPHIPAPQKSITLNSVSFAYHAHMPILLDASLTIAHGERIGMIGPSGVGKSTISDLLLRFLEPTSGSILFDGNSINAYSVASVRTHTGYVGQHPFLFNDTVFANVASGSPHATMDEVVFACKQAYAHQFIMQLTDGYHTNVGENGKLLSGGQKQRLTIARALLRRPAILIFDEATSALDEESEKSIEQTVAALDRTTTIIVISHRPGLLTRMDKIFTIKNHMLVQTGTISPNHSLTLQK